jgi:hypothetical protein
MLAQLLRAPNKATVRPGLNDLRLYCLISQMAKAALPVHIKEIGREADAHRGVGAPGCGLRHEYVL